MDDMLPFLRVIAENPGDDAPRLVFADWLDEHGHPERAEFIRLQIELARTEPAADGYAEMTARMRRCGILTGERKYRFFDHLPTKKCRIGFRRGFIEAIATADAAEIDDSGFDLVPLQALRTGSRMIEKFRCFPNLKKLDYHYQDDPPSRLLELFGPNGPFKNLEELSLSGLSRACFEVGVIPKFDLPRLRNYYLYSPDFSELGVPAVASGEEDEDDYAAPPWGGLPDYLPRNALPGPGSPLERVIWHADDDSDSYRGDDWDWRGPTMEALFTHLKDHDLKQIEVAIDHDDHEGGNEGVIAASYRQNPLTLSPTLERITLHGSQLRLLAGCPRELKELRVYGEFGLEDSLPAILGEPVCSALEALHVEVRGWWDTEPEAGPSVTLSKLKCLSGAYLKCYANWQFPNIISLRGANLEAVLERKWPKLQRLTIHDSDIPHLKTFAESDCCPHLTTLTITDFYGQQEPDLSFLSNCPHMPHLSLIRIPHYRTPGNYVVGGGRLIPVRGDILTEEITPYTPFRLRHAFSLDPE
jgi:uncharacterized protein (TIGR02996 family)